MRAWLRPILDRLSAGLIPVDGDSGRREAACENETCPEVQRVSSGSCPRVEDTVWIPSTILFGPPL